VAVSLLALVHECWLGLQHLLYTRSVCVVQHAVAAVCSLWRYTRLLSILHSHFVIEMLTCVFCFREILPEDVLLPEAGRNVASKIGAQYYETSVLVEFGLDHVFMNVIRAALVGRRSRHFYMAVGPLKNISLPELQAPHLLPPPPVLSVIVSRLSVDVDYSALIGNSAFVDVVFEVCGVSIGAHSACLIMSSAVFSDLLSIAVLGRDGSETVRCRTGDAPDFCGASRGGRIFLDHPVFGSVVRATLAMDGSFMPPKVAIVDTVSLSAFRVVLHFLYAGTLPPMMAHWCPDVHRLAELLYIPSLEQAVANVSTEQDFLNVEVYRDVRMDRCYRVRSVLLQEGMFSGMSSCCEIDSTDCKKIK